MSGLARASRSWAFLCTGSHDIYDAGFKLKTAPITIRTASWVAAQAFVAPGVQVNEGSVISAGSVVFDDVPAHTVVQGNPAVVVRDLHEEAVAH